MKTRKVRVRRMKIGIGQIETSPSWSASELKFIEYQNQQKVEVSIAITDPWQLFYLRRELDKITAYWKEKVQL